MKTIYSTLIILVLMAGSFFAGRSFRPSVEPEYLPADTVIRVDTIRDTLLIPKNIYLVRVDTVWLAVPAEGGQRVGRKTVPNDTLSDRIAVVACSGGGQRVGLRPTSPDSALVVIPIEQKEYKTDDYRAIIEGYRPSLVSMEVYPKTTTITRTEVRYELTKPKWGIGLQAGYGIPVNGRPAPYIGVGVTYNFITW